MTKLAGLDISIILMVVTRTTFLWVAMFVFYACDNVKLSQPHKRIIVIHEDSELSSSQTAKLNPWIQSDDEGFTVFVKSELDKKILLSVGDSLIFEANGPFEKMISFEDDKRNSLFEFRTANATIEFDIPPSARILRIRNDSLRTILSYY